MNSEKTHAFEMSTDPVVEPDLTLGRRTLCAAVLLGLGGATPLLAQTGQSPPLQSASRWWKHSPGRSPLQGKLYTEISSGPSSA
jgi:hypothetical protein